MKLTRGPATLYALKQSLKAQVDEAAERAYAAPGQGLAAVHRWQADEARTFRSTGEIGPFVRAEMKASGTSAEASVDTILAAERSTKASMASVKLVARQMKRAIDAATTVEAARKAATWRA